MVVYIAATLAYGVSDDRFCTSSARGKGFENVETTVWYDAGQNGSSNSMGVGGIFALSNESRRCFLFLDQSADGGASTYEKGFR